MIHIENMQQPGLCENLYTSHQLTPLLQYPRIKQKEMIIFFFSLLSFEPITKQVL